MKKMQVFCEKILEIQHDLLYNNTYRKNWKCRNEKVKLQNR